MFDKTKNVMWSYGTSSSQYTQAKEELNSRFGNPNFVVAAFTRELENFEQLHVQEPQRFVRFVAFQRKLVHSFKLNTNTSDLNSSNLNRLACSNGKNPAYITGWNIQRSRISRTGLTTTTTLELART